MDREAAEAAAAAAEERKREIRRMRERNQKAREMLIGKIQLTILLIVLTLIPAIILFAQANSQRTDCVKVKKKCHDRCTTVFSEVKRIYASQYAREDNCNANCVKSDDTCMTEVATLAGGATFLLICLGVSLCLIQLMQSMMQSAEEDVAALARKVPRSAYEEPTITEEERVKKLQEKPSMWQRLSKSCRLPCMRRDDHDGSWDTTEARCMQCKDQDGKHQLVKVDVHWLAEKGCLKAGMKSAICPRCRMPVVGIL